MIYLDTSVALAYLRAEDRRPPDDFWLGETLVSSRLLEYELLNRLHAYNMPPAALSIARDLVARIGLVELIPEILSSAREPLSEKLRTLDALHLATIAFFVAQGVDISVATYDERMREGAKKLKVRTVAP